MTMLAPKKSLAPIDFHSKSISFSLEVQRQSFQRVILVSIAKFKPPSVNTSLRANLRHRMFEHTIAFFDSLHLVVLLLHASDFFFNLSRLYPMGLI